MQRCASECSVDQGAPFSVATQCVSEDLVHLETDQAAAVLKVFAERQRNEVLVRIATLDGIQPSALKDLNEVDRKSTRLNSSHW